MVKVHLTLIVQSILAKQDICLSFAQYFARMKWISIQFSVTSKDDVTALCNAQILFKNKHPSVLLSNFDSIHKISKLGSFLWFYNILLSKGFRIYFNFNFNGCKRVEDVNSYSTFTKSLLCYKKHQACLHVHDLSILVDWCFASILQKRKLNVEMACHMVFERFKLPLKDKI